MIILEGFSNITIENAVLKAELRYQQEQIDTLQKACKDLEDKHWRECWQIAQYSDQERNTSTIAEPKNRDEGARKIDAIDALLCFMAMWCNNSDKSCGKCPMQDGDGLCRAKVLIYDHGAATQLLKADAANGTDCSGAVKDTLKNLKKEVKMKKSICDHDCLNCKFDACRCSDYPTREEGEILRYWTTGYDKRMQDDNAKNNYYYKNK